MGQAPSSTRGPADPPRRYTLGDGRPAVGLGACREAVDTHQAGRPVWLFLFSGAEGTPREGDAAFGERAARIGHANVLRVLDHGRWQDTPFVATEPADAFTLAGVLEGLRSTGAWAALDDVRQAFDALCQGVAAGHRDRTSGSPEHGMLSPRSVLLGGHHDPGRPLGAQEVKVMDFGLARWLGLRCPMPEGVADARAPEQRADPSALSPAGDVFALGALLATMLAPHEAGLAGRVWADLAQRGDAAMRSFLGGLRRDVPHGVWDEVARALSAAPTTRHPDADRLRTALRRCDWTPIADPPAPRTRPPVSTAPEVSRAVPLPRTFSAEATAAPMALRTSPSAATVPSPAPPAEPAPTLDPVRSFATESPDTVVQTFAPDEAEPTARSFATETPDTVVEPPRAQPPAAVTPAARRRNAPRPLAEPPKQMLQARAALPATPAAPSPAPEPTASVALFAPPVAAFDDRGRTLPFGAPAASRDLFAEYLSPPVAPEVPAPVAPSTPPPPQPPTAPAAPPVAPSLAAGPLDAPVAPPRALGTWHAAPPPDTVQQFHLDLFAHLPPVAAPEPAPEPLWRRALVLVAAGLAAAFVSFLVGLWLFAPSR
jgi:serine/threonine protein kinase